MKKSELNNIAKRKVVKTSRFAKLMKKGSCKVDRKSEGDTLHTVKSMADAVKHYQHQTKELSKALLGKSLQETIIKNYKFLYSHFQYEADGFLQQLRSPECSFTDRFTGIDCKSYSLFASTLLLNQNILHYIRRIKQPQFNPDHWSHVYIVVPKDQDKGNLELGYYIIDGTLHINEETPYIEKHDTKMGTSMPHVWLNGAALNASSVEPSGDYNEENNSNSKGGWLDNAASSFDFENIFKDFKFSDIGSLFSHIDCIGGSAYGGTQINDDLTRLKQEIEKRTKQINKAVFNRDLVALANAVSLFTTTFSMIHHAAALKQAEKKWNSCSDQNMTAFKTQAAQVEVKGNAALNAWVKHYFNRTKIGEKQYSNTSINHFWIGNTQPVQVYTVPVFSFQVKDLDAEIKPFVFNQNVMDQNHNNFNISSYLDTIQDVIVMATTTTPQNPNYTGDTLDPSGMPKPQKAGFNPMIALGVLVLAGGAYAYNKYQSEQPTKTKAKK